jgi:putative addiction module component (TIGR02574 family)
MNMSPTELSQLLKLPPAERAELAITLWESLTEAERDAELELDESARAELDRRWREHLAEPGSAIPWEDVRRKLRDET